MFMISPISSRAESEVRASMKELKASKLGWGFEAKKGSGVDVMTTLILSARGLYFRGRESQVFQPMITALVFEDFSSSEKSILFWKIMSEKGFHFCVCCIFVN